MEHVELFAHGVDGGRVGGLLVAAPDQVGAGERGLLGDPCEAQREHAVIEVDIGGHEIVPLNGRG